MNIDQINNNELKNFPTSSSCEINCLHIKIKDFKPIVKEFETHISDTSWINSLNEISKKVFKVNAEKTIDKIITDIIGGITTSVNEDITEFNDFEIFKQKLIEIAEATFAEHLPSDTEFAEEQKEKFDSVDLVNSLLVDYEINLRKINWI